MEVVRHVSNDDDDGFDDVSRALLPIEIEMGIERANVHQVLYVGVVDHLVRLTHSPMVHDELYLVQYYYN